ncbi:hypothetical protein DACRYDRAFT_115493 [Dacryopinax primogenitus]|uniref:Uncharacterized protein n=1 Tax=Dacryopinax primogenitus (strain DJM 731) TaxID=1858805 RepID=M5G3Q3_DACPD|nr:uncharacterized protein DACRYDRAFT_115493 [Dacryopinax primogenitus]EJU03304.1 hypothetical protein DACRYDRAFT_115493 [Dacryopinax primogenitus]
MNPSKIQIYPGGSLAYRNWWHSRVAEENLELTSNSPEETEEELELERQIEAVVVKIQTLQEACSAARDEHSELCIKLEATRDRIVQNTHPRPVTAVPDDILLQIFELGSLTGPELFIKSRFDNLHATPLWNIFPMNVSQVCRRWRMVAINHPKLWTRYLAHNTPTQETPALDCWLSRSGNMPLHLHLRCSANPVNGCYSTRHGPCPRFRKPVREMSRRLVSLSVEGCIHTCMHAISDLGPSAPLLREIRVKTGNCLNRRNDQADPNVLSKRVLTPGLTDAHLEGFPALLRMIDTSRLAHLTLGCSLRTRELHTMRMDLDLFLNVIKTLSELRSLIINSFVFPAISELEDDQALGYLPNLTTLKLLTAPIGHHYAWMAQIRMPVLESLEIASAWSDDNAVLAGGYREEERAFFSTVPSVERVVVTYRPQVSTVVLLLLEGFLSHLQTLTVHMDMENHHRTTPVEWTKDIPRRVALLVQRRWEQDKMLSEVLVDPPLFEGEAANKNYALELLKPMDEIGEVAEFGLEDLFDAVYDVHVSPAS